MLSRVDKNITIYDNFKDNVDELGKLAHATFSISTSHFEVEHRSLVQTVLSGQSLQLGPCLYGLSLR